MKLHDLIICTQRQKIRFQIDFKFYVDVCFSGART